MTNRKEQLFYEEALKKKLPIGWGEIESAHRYVVQHRFKLAEVHGGRVRISITCYQYSSKGQMIFGMTTGIIWQQ